MGKSFRVPVVGLLGGDVWSAGPFTVDYRDSVVVTHRREGFCPPLGVEAEDLTMSGEERRGDGALRAGVPTVAGTINGVPAKVLLDTGSGNSLVIEPRLMGMHPEWGDAEKELLSITAAVVGGKYVPVKVKECRVLGRELGEVGDAAGMMGEWKSSEGVGAAYGRAWLTGSDEALIGTTILEDFRLTFDYQGGRLWAERRPRLTVEERVTRGMVVNALDLADLTPLMLAIDQRREGDVAALLKVGARVDVRGHGGQTAGHALARNGTVRMLEAIAASGQKVDWDCAEDQGGTPMFAAMYGWNEAVAERWLEMGADPNGVCAGISMLQLAALRGEVGLYEALLRAGARKPGKGEVTVLQLAAYGGRAGMVRHLLKKGGEDLESQDDGGKTAFLMAVMTNHVEAARMLLETGANAGARTKKGESAWDLAQAAKKKGEDVEAMLKLLGEGGHGDGNALRR